MTNNSNTAKRFGARYGNILRKKVSRIESSSRARHKCRSCGRDKVVKRISYGVWKCRKCGFEFVGRAYSPY